MDVTLCNDKKTWNDCIEKKQGHPLQLWGWGEVKANHNWRADRFLVRDQSGEMVGGAQVLTREIPILHKTIAYIPRGPFCNNTDTAKILDEITKIVKKECNSIGLICEPDREGDFQLSKGWKKAKNNILLSKTLILDLNKTVDELLSDMTKKTRQYIRKSSKENITIKRVYSKEEIKPLMEIYHQTAQRADFALHEDKYYYDVAEKLGDSSVIYVAYEGENPVSFVWLAESNNIAFELYGGMNDRGQSLRANYTLKWYAITDCKKRGVKRYDMNGLLNDGISTFKRNFASHENQLVGTLEFAFSPIYPVWSTLLPAAKKVFRAIKGSNRS